MTVLIEETFAFGLVIGCSVFGILWGVVNTLLVSYYLSFSINPWNSC